MHTYRLLISCPDRPGIVMAVSSCLYRRGANIIDAAQHTTDAEAGTFLMRIEYALDPPERQTVLEESFAGEVGDRFQMVFRFYDCAVPKRIAILVSRHDHCLVDLLGRWKRLELDAAIVQVISNHRDLAGEVTRFEIPYSCVPMDEQTKTAGESKILRLLHGRVDLVVLARYMQILSGDFIDRIGLPIINIHHSFLPAFVGADPYRRAFERGVKIIGATAHYVTEDLDAGPIIEQDVERVSHHHDLQELKRIGRDIERIVLARAVAWHLDDRVLLHGNRTFVFH